VSVSYEHGMSRGSRRRREAARLEVLAAALRARGVLADEPGEARPGARAAPTGAGALLDGGDRAAARAAVRARRRELRLTQAALGAAAGVSGATVSYLERGPHWAREDSREAIAAVLWPEGGAGR
jgi:DNA-binding XRE family transcriptional regulator